MTIAVCIDGGSDPGASLLHRTSSQRAELAEQSIGNTCQVLFPALPATLSWRISQLEKFSHCLEIAGVRCIQSVPFVRNAGSALKPCLRFGNT
jgi:hypothetical protein